MSSGMRQTTEWHLLGVLTRSVAGTGLAVIRSALGGIAIVARLALVTLGTICVIPAAL